MAEPQDDSPAAAARRALRAARERDGDRDRADLPGEASEGPPPPDQDHPSHHPAPRPGDAVRAALRLGSTQTGGPTEEGHPEPGEPAARERGASTPRPADLAREALRAARAQSRHSAATSPSAPPSGPASAPRRPTGARDSRDPVARDRARDVRQFLTDAFRMPPETAPASESAPSSEPAPLPEVGHPATPAARTPVSMAAPFRDGDHRRTFPAFPPLATAGPGDDTPVAETWWGNAWVAALEEGALDLKRLARGRAYAQRGNVDAITVTPGLVLAYVRGSRPRPYRVQVRLRTFGEADWERFLDAAVEHPAHLAALLDKELPESLAECGAELLPGPGDLDPHCGCPDRAHPCKHAAALCYQTARLLDADPFVLLLLRGRGERELLDALSRRNAAHAARTARAAREEDAAALPGVRASEVMAAPVGQLPPLPAPLPVPAHPGQPPAHPPVPDGPDSFALDHLATDAAARAHALLTTGHDDIGELTLWQDAVRLAAARPGSGLTAATRALYASLAAAVGRTPSDLARAVAAWRQGGPEGLTVLEEPWDPPAGRFDRARPLLLAADLPAFRPRRNHLTHPSGHLQLRFGQDGLWYPYESEPGSEDWWPRGTPDPDPVGALTGLGGGTGEP